MSWAITALVIALLAVRLANVKVRVRSGPVDVSVEVGGLSKRWKKEEVEEEVSQDDVS